MKPFTSTLADCRRSAALLLTGLSGLIALGSAVPAAAQSQDRTSYVLFSADSDSSTMRGSTDDFRQARSLRSGREALLFVRQDGTTYVIRDAATLREADRIFAPQRALGAQQSELGSQQSALGRRQAALGAEQARLGRQMADSPKRAGEYGREQAELGRQQAELGQQQGALGARQGALGREQARLARIAHAELHTLIAEAIRRGAAQRVN